MQRYNLVLVWIEGLVRLLGICFGTWVCLKVFDYANQLTDRRKKTGSIRGRSNSIRQGSSNIAQIITLTVVCLAFFTLAQIGALAVDISIIVCTFYNTKSLDWHYNKDSTVQFFNWWTVLFVVFALLTLTFNSFERLISTFIHTQYKLTDREVIYGRLYFIIMVCFAPFIFWMQEEQNQWADRFLMSTAAVMFAVFTGWVIYSFHTKSIAIVHGMAVVSVSNNEDNAVSDAVTSPTVIITQEESTETSNHVRMKSVVLSGEKGMTLAHTALRMTICTGLPLISSFLIGLAAAINDKSTGYTTLAIVNGLDLMLNSFCVMCTFKQSIDCYYRPVFGPFHDYLFRILFE